MLCTKSAHDVSQRLDKAQGFYAKVYESEGAISVPTNYRCTHPDCVDKLVFFKTKQCLARHAMLHYPPGFFCPICCDAFVRPDSLSRHIKVSCARNSHTAAKRFGITITKASLLAGNKGGELAAEYTIMVKYQWYFNLYWLGAMEKFAWEIRLSDEHFELLSNRRRADPIGPPYMAGGGPGSEKLLRRDSASKIGTSDRDGLGNIR